MKLNFCVLCGTTEKLHHHHVIPKVQGGTNDEDNFITLCFDHHAGSINRGLRFGSSLSKRTLTQ